LKNNHLHIVCFDIPLPANYGGVIDIFYKIKALSGAGIKIHLHCYKYGREESEELLEFCDEVFYYKRNVSKSGLFHSLPYIIQSRSNNTLLERLAKDEYPILFEGLHTCYFLDHPKLTNRLKFVRAHNVEHEYYENLAKVERNIFKKYYFSNEANKLKRFEQLLAKAEKVFAISKNDTKHFESQFSNAFYLPAFHPNELVTSKEGVGNYVLYHGNLAIGENDEAARYLINNVFNDLDIPFVICGSNPSSGLIKDAAKHSNIRIDADISTEEIHKLISEAQINILPTFQPTGIKLKLLSALFNGRHCIVNTPMVKNTGLESLCIVADDPQSIKLEVLKIFEISFSDQEIRIRSNILNEDFSNKKSAKILLSLIND